MRAGQISKGYIVTKNTQSTSGFVSMSCFQNIYISACPDVFKQIIGHQRLNSFLVLVALKLWNSADARVGASNENAFVWM